MARQLRHDYAGGWYHVMPHGFQRQVIFREDPERKHFLGLLAGMAGRYGVILHGLYDGPGHGESRGKSGNPK